MPNHTDTPCADVCTSSPSRIDPVTRLASQASALAALLTMLEILPPELMSPDKYESNLALCADIAADLARDLVALTPFAS